MSTEWPHFLADLKAKRDCLTQVIETIEKNFAVGTLTSGVQIVESPDELISGGRRTARRKQKAGKRALRNGRTDGRTDGAKGGPSRNAEPP